jgi:predicted outer membrane repeat protein
MSTGGVGDVACLIDAITEANKNGEMNTITLEAGTYTLTAVNNTTNGPNGLPVITSTLTITGAGADATIIERQASAPPFRLLLASGLTLNGLTLQGGLLEPNTNFESTLGGGIYGSNLTLTNCSLTHNTAYSGGGIYGSSITLTNCSLTHNTAAAHGGAGGGIFGINLTRINCSLTHNSADFGGGLASNVTTVRLTDCSLTYNHAGVGGGILTQFDTVTLTNSTLAHNTAKYGGGIASWNSRVMLTNSTLVYNTATLRDSFGGGGIANLSGTLRLTNSTLAHNTAGYVGGGLFIPYGLNPTTLQNTILALNTAPPMLRLHRRIASGPLPPSAPTSLATQPAVSSHGQRAAVT